MKKIFVLLLIIAASLNAMATDYAVATLTLKGNTSLEQGEVTLAKTDDPTASSYCAPLYIDQYQVVMYALNGDVKYQIWANADLTNFPLGIKTYSDASYTITVSNVSGSETLSLYDAVEDQSIALTEGQTYVFSAAANSTIDNRFVINYVAPAPSYVTTLTTNAYGYASFSWNADLAVPAGLKVYKGAINGDCLDLTEMDYVKAGEGVIVYGAANTEYGFVAGSGSADYDGNDLKPTSAYTIGDQNVYVLKDNELRLFVGSNALAANKAYLQLPGGANNAPKRISFRYNATTGVQNVKAELKAEKFIENGQVLIRRGEAVYNLQGQMVR